MTNKNPSKWKVTSNYVGGKTLYGVYRTRDINEIDHSGNRENVGRLFESRDLAEALASALNEEV